MKSRKHRKKRDETPEPKGCTDQNLPQTEEQAHEQREQVKAKAAFDHTRFLSAALYGNQVASVAGKGSLLQSSSTAYAVDLWERFQPRDSVEELLFTQMLQTHGRLMYLNVYAQQQKHTKWAALMYEAADRAANTYRRQMLALAEYRRPPRPRSFTAIGQANIAQQQIVQNGGAGSGGNGKTENETATNEKGSTAGPPALPPDAGGAGIPAAVDRRDEAVAADARAGDGGGQGA